MAKPPDLDAIRRRMEWFDSLPPELREVMNGLPVSNLLPYAIEAGCSTQAEAEEWVRSVIGRSVVESAPTE